MLCCGRVFSSLCSSIDAPQAQYNCIFRYTCSIYLQYYRFVFVMFTILPQYIRYPFAIYPVRIYSRCSKYNRQNDTFLWHSLCHPLLFVIHPQYIIDDNWSQSLLIAVYIWLWYLYNALKCMNNGIHDTWKMYAWHSLLNMRFFQKGFSITLSLKAWCILISIKLKSSLTATNLYPY